MRIISGRARGLRLAAPKNYDVRPTADRVKESVFNIIGSRIIGSDVVDLFAGTGSLGLESWSRGAASVVFIDASAEALKLVRSNIAKCRASDACSVFKGTAESAVAELFRSGRSFDFAFCDPPYNCGQLEKIALTLREYPFIREGGYLIVERSLQEALPELPGNCQLVRSNRYGDTIVDFVKYWSGEISSTEK